jgi:hypothetical protein
MPARVLLQGLLQKTFPKVELRCQCFFLSLLVVNRLFYSLWWFGVVWRRFLLCAVCRPGEQGFVLPGLPDLSLISSFPLFRYFAVFSEFRGRPTDLIVLPLWSVFLPNGMNEWYG